MLRCKLESLALAGWQAGTARVVSVAVTAGRAEVALQVNGDYDYWEYFVRSPDGDWRGASSGNGPTVGWHDPSVIHWDS